MEAVLYDLKITFLGINLKKLYALTPWNPQGYKIQTWFFYSFKDYS
jgi:hypothetical protein